MTELVWTDEKPAEGGWYWFMAISQLPPSGSGAEPPMLTSVCRPAIVLVGKDGMGCYVRFPQGLWYVTRMPGKWAGPILEPAEFQLPVTTKREERNLM